MAENYEYEHTHIELKHGYATFLGKDFKPSDELLNALNKMAELAYNECGGLKVNTGGRQLTIPDVVLRREQLESGLTCMMCRKPKHNDGHTCCEECAGLAF